jgi:hypothetical protein
MLAALHALEFGEMVIAQLSSTCTDQLVSVNAFVLLVRHHDVAAHINTHILLPSAAVLALYSIALPLLSILYMHKVTMLPDSCGRPTHSQIKKQNTTGLSPCRDVGSRRTVHLSNCCLHVLRTAAPWGGCLWRRTKCVNVMHNTNWQILMHVFVAPDV